MASKKQLTPKQQRFAELVASGKCLTDAYRASYNAAGMKPATIRNESSRLFCRPDITMTIERLRERREEAVASAAVSDRDRVLAKLRTMMDDAAAEMAQLRAAELLGKSVGLFKDVQVQEQQRSAAEIRAELMERLAALTDEPDSKVH